MDKALENATTKVSISCLILAGGLGTRMGGADKGWLPVHGQHAEGKTGTFAIEQCLHNIALQNIALKILPPDMIFTNVALSNTIISANRNLDRYRALEHTVVTDAAEFAQCGPMAGIEAGLSALLKNTEMQVVDLLAGEIQPLRFLCIMPCDVWEIPHNFMQKLYASLHENPQCSVAVAKDQHGRWQPTLCMLRLDANMLDAVQAYLRLPASIGANRSVKGFIATQPNVAVGFDVEFENRNGA